MVQIIENWTEVLAGVVEVHPSSKRSGQVEARLAVTSAAPVEGFASFLHESSGTEITVFAPADMLPRLSHAVGKMIGCRIRRGQRPEDVFINADSFRVVS